jgi:hypothetical protein
LITSGLLDFSGLSRYLPRTTNYPQIKKLPYEVNKFILRIDNNLKTDGEPQPLRKTAKVTETPKSTVWRVIKFGP